MSRLSIIVAPDPRLKRRAEPVGAADAAVRRLMDDMLETMHAANGIGLAAPQVGVLKRVIVVDVAGPDEAPQPLRLADPQIVWRSETVISGEEGCLSLPKQYAEVCRSTDIRVRYIDYDNTFREMDASGLLARCLQHEIDHLEGTLFVDHVSSLRRSIILRRLAKNRRAAVDAAV